MLKKGDIVRLRSADKKDSFLIELEPGRILGSRLGEIIHDDIIKSDFGGIVRLSSGVSFYVLRPALAHFCLKVKRRTQIIYPKESGYLLVHLNVFPGGRVIECGSGSGSMTAVLAQFVGDEGTVFSYDRNEEFQELALRNCTRWGVEKRVEFRLRNVVERGFEEENVDAIFLDLKNPWDVLFHARRALLPGGRIGIILSTFNQMERVLKALPKNGFVDPRIVEILQRTYKTSPGHIRPEDAMVGHTGYLLFASSIAPELVNLEVEDENDDR